MRQELGPGGDGRDHGDVVGGAADPLGETAEEHPVVVDECQADGRGHGGLLLFSDAEVFLQVCGVVDEALDVDTKTLVLG